MDFLKGIFSNFLSFIFTMLAVGAFIFAIVSFFIGDLPGSPWLCFIIFIVVALIFMAIAIAFAKRARDNRKA